MANNQPDNIPAPLTYGTVTGHFISVLADSSDFDSFPDIIKLTGTVSIGPVIRSFRVTDTAGNVNLVVAQDITAKIVNGALLAPDGLTPLRLLATDSPGVSPGPIQYTAKFNLAGVTAQPAPITFSVPSNGTVDLTSILSVPVSAPVQTIVSDASRIAAEAARDEAIAAVAKIAGVAQIGIDTDGVPYFSDGLAVEDARNVLIDTDGVPYVEV